MSHIYSPDGKSNQHLSLGRCSFPDAHLQDKALIERSEHFMNLYLIFHMIWIGKSIFFINPAQVGSLHLHHWKMFFISIQGGRVLTDTNRNEKVFSFSVFSTRTKKMHILTGIEGITTCRRKKERQPFRRQKDNSVLINSRKQSVRLTIFYESWSTCGLRSRFFSAVQISSVCLSLNGRV